MLTRHCLFDFQNLAIASADQTTMVSTFSPEIVGGIAAPQDPNQAVTSYSDYLMNAKKQVAAAKELEKTLIQQTLQVAKVLDNWNDPSNFIT